MGVAHRKSGVASLCTFRCVMNRYRQISVIQQIIRCGKSKFLVNKLFINSNFAQGDANAIMLRFDYRRYIYIIFTKSDCIFLFAFKSNLSCFYFQVIEPKVEIKKPAQKKNQHFVFFFGSEN